MRIDFDWDPAKAASNAAKHGVTFKKAMTVFANPFALSIADPDIAENGQMQKFLRWGSFMVPSQKPFCGAQPTRVLHLPREPLSLDVESAHGT